MYPLKIGTFELQLAWAEKAFINAPFSAVTFMPSEWEQEVALMGIGQSCM